MLKTHITTGNWLGIWIMNTQPVHSRCIKNVIASILAEYKMSLLNWDSFLSVSFWSKQTFDALIYYSFWSHRPVQAVKGGEEQKMQLRQFVATTLGMSLCESGAPACCMCEPVQLFDVLRESTLFFIGLKEKLIPGCQPEFEHKLNIRRWF